MRTTALPYFHGPVHIKTERACILLPQQGWQVVFYGDSIVERLRGTSQGGANHQVGTREAFQRYVSSKYSAEALGIGGELGSRRTNWCLEVGLQR